MKEQQQDYQEYYVQHDDSGKKRRKKIIIAFACLIALVALIAAFWLLFYNFNLRPVGDNTKEVIVNIPNGSTIDDIGQILDEKGLIRNQMVFRSYAGRKNRSEGQIQAGIYAFSQSMSVPEIVSKMIKGEMAIGESAVTITEGMNMKEIAALLEKNHICSADAFLSEASRVSFYKTQYSLLGSIPEGKTRTLEGYLFPDTYCWYNDTAPDQVVKAMLDRFVQVYNAELLAATKAIGKSIDEIVILASIVELETKLPEDKANAASVFYNRIEAGMPLQSDITVDYALGSKHDVLTVEQTQTDSPYNTYINKGLPLGPICSPGKSSIEAALHPADTEYYYFVADMKTGKLHFNKTVEEHDADAAEYMY